MDDSRELRELYQMILEGAGYSVQTVSSAEEALELVKRTRPDLLVVDVIMPGMGGLELLMHMRSDLAPPLPPSIVCSGFEITEEDALRRGAFAFLRKPFCAKDLLAFVELALSARSAVAELSQTEQAHAAAARRRAVEAADAALETCVIPPQSTSARTLAWLAAYFGFHSGVLVLLRHGKLEVVGSSHAEVLAIGSTVDTQLPFCAEIVQSGSSLILADFAAHPSFAPRARMLTGIRGFAGVPLCTPEGIAIGTLCLFDEGPRRMTAEDACMLELIGRRSSMILLQGRSDERGPGLPLADVPVLMIADSFRVFLDMELRLAHRFEHTLEVAILEVSAQAIPEAVEAIERGPSLERLAIGLLGSTRLGVLKRAATTAETTRALVRVFDDVRAVDGSLQVGVFAVAAPPVRFGEQDVLRMAGEVLDSARSEVVRVVVRAENPTRPEP